nr:hypothetical protein [uncultured Flavobacterium sp.]
MPDINDISIPQFASDILPPEERSVENVSALTGFLSAFGRQWGIFLAFLRGADNHYGAASWSAGTYNAGDIVIRFQSGEVFECLLDGTTSEPTPSAEWKKILDSFIGVQESQNFWGGTLALTYALNRRFMTTFNDPPTNSDIYIVNTPLATTPFIVGDSETTSSTVGDYVSSAFVMDTYSIAPTYAFDIQVPSALISTLGTDAENIIRKFVDKYLTAGLNYTVTPY